MTSEFQHKTIGQIRLQRRTDCKRISISVGRGGRVTVTYPWLVRRSKVVEFIEQKAEWIVTTQQRLAAATQKPIIQNGYRTRSHTLRIEQCATQNGHTVHTGEVVVSLQTGIAADSAQGQEIIRTALIETLRREAHELLPAMVERAANQHGFRYNGLTIKNIHSKWGSCSSTNHLNFSLYLMLLPDELIEFVVLHELCHTVHKDHSERFHALLNSILNGREQTLNRELRKYRTSI